MKRLIALLLVLVLVLGCLCACSDAEDETQEDPKNSENISADSGDSKETETTRGEDRREGNGKKDGWLYVEYTYHIEIQLENKYLPIENGVLEIPSEIDGKPVTHVKAYGNGYVDCSEVESFIVPDTVEYIYCNTRDRAGTIFPNMTEFRVPANLKNIDDFFQETPWYQTLTDEYVIIGDGILIKYNGAHGHDVTLVIPEGVKRIVNAFEYFWWAGVRVDFNDVQLPNTLEVIGKRAFYGVDEIESLTMPSSVREIERVAFGEVGIREMVWSENLKEIPEGGLAAWDRYSIVLPATIEKIHGKAFGEDIYDLEEITILNPNITEMADFEANTYKKICFHIPEGSKLAAFFDEKGVNYDYNIG